MQIPAEPMSFRSHATKLGDTTCEKSQPNERFLSEMAGFSY